MRNWLVGLILIFLSANLFAQEALNQFKYISVETMFEEETGRYDRWEISMYTRYTLLQSGFNVIPDNRNNWPAEILEDECSVLYCDILDRTKKLGKNKLDFHFINCQGDTVFVTKGFGYKGKDKQSYREAIDMAFKFLDKFEYEYVATAGNMKPLTNLPESDFRKYLDSAEVKPIEGIYMFKEGENSIRLGIRRSREGFNGIVLESKDPAWKPSETRLRLKTSLLGEDVFNISWISSSKEEIQTVGKQQTDGNLILELKSDDQIVSVTLEKVYPE